MNNDTILHIIKALEFYANKKHIRMCGGYPNPQSFQDGDLHLEGTWLMAPDYDVYHDTEDGTVAKEALQRLVLTLMEIKE